ncbi:MAG: hypothetical protein JO270_19460 [Acidobacteriaceae bacterium]|nr:hypothetical protein [Acidobacteriaceae bacterium]
MSSQNQPRFFEPFGPARHDLSMVELERILVDKIRVEVTHRWDRHHLDCLRNHLNLTVALDPVAQNLVFRLQSYVLGKDTSYVDATERVPADWWQALRQRWFPGWWLRRWPLRWRVIEIRRIERRMCPHLNRKFPEEQRHLEWIVNRERDKVET